MNKPSQERIERASEGIKPLLGELCADKILGIPSRITAKAIAEAALTADDSHLAAKLERVMKLLGEAWDYIKAADMPVELWFYEAIRAELSGENRGGE